MSENRGIKAGGLQQKNRRKTKEDEEAAGVGDGGNQHRGAEGGVGSKFEAE